MTIKVTYNVTDVYMTQSVSPVYINVSYGGGTSGGGVWGTITGTLSNQTDLQTALDGKFDDPTGTTAQYLRGDGSLATFPSLTGYVPYTGATTNVDLGEYELKAGQLTLDVSPTGTAAVGTTRWNDTTGVSETTLKGGNVLLRNGVDLVARVVNKVTPNTTLTKAAYQAVRVSGAQGQRLAVAFAQANNDANSADTIGLVTETIPTNQEGFIMAVGQLENINTTGSLQGETWNDGDVLYLSPTIAGAITKVKPTGNGHIVVIGYVEYAHANNGKIYVKVMNGWELDELHDVSIVSPANNEALIYESSTSLWKNKTIATALGYTPANAATTLTINGVTYDLSTSRTWTISAGISGTIATGQVAYATAADTIGGSNNLFWDAANGRLGIGTNSPTANLSVVKNINGDNTFYVLNNSNGVSGRNLFLIGEASTGGNYGTLQYINSGYNSTGLITANTTILAGHSTGGLTLAAFDATGTIKFGAGNSSSALMTLTATGALRFNSPSGSNNTYLEGFNSSGTLVSKISEASTVGSGGLYFQGARLSDTSGGAILFAGYVGSSGNTSALEFRGVGGTISTIADLPSGIPIAIFSKRSGGATVNQMMLFQTGNLVLQNGGTFTDGGQRLQVYGDTLLRGSGATSATTALTVQDSGSLNLFRVRNDGRLDIGTIGGETYIAPTQNGTTINKDGRGLIYSSAGIIGAQAAHTFTVNGGILTGGGYLMRLSTSFAANAGSVDTTFLWITPTINQTGGTHITRGLYVNPTLTAAADFRAIEWNNNTTWGLYGSGTANNYLGGNIAIGSTSNTTNWLNIAASTTAKAHIFLAAGVTPTSPADGDIWFDGTDIKMRIGGVTKTFTLI